MNHGKIGAGQRRDILTSAASVTTTIVTEDGGSKTARDQ